MVFVGVIIAVYHFLIDIIQHLLFVMGCCKAIENKLVNYKDVKCVDSPDTPGNT